MLVDEVDADLGKVGSALQDVTAHQRRKIHCRGNTEISLVIDDILRMRENITHGPCNLVRACQRGSRRGINLEQECVGVVVGQHFKFDAQRTERPVHARRTDELP